MVDKVFLATGATCKSKCQPDNSPDSVPARLTGVSRSGGVRASVVLAGHFDYCDGND
ncbi:MAG: hypothetical protein KKF20_06550 [Bacteroidetes bacterium]|nr:hypothetical protein [Bacteroidota bacterium]MBU1422531.1 hypothetical protein [Bacteroidota bacterium]MBU2472050.1 hypothetical protein [Bacteroidota bacterium]MBU2635664.1 hypothetical protein [Bacteroidota bacterium]